MKILFLHPNFPGQFKHLSKAAARAGHEVKFLCQTHYGRSIEGVQRLKLTGKNSHEELKKDSLPLVKQTIKLASQYRSGLVSLQKLDWNPDIVISHSGWGCGFYVKEIWPKTRHITYLEWWFNPESQFFWYDEENKELGINRESITKHWDRNQFVSHELAASDAIVSPTFWQREQLPKLLRTHCHVIFDGVDTDNFYPKLTLRSEKPVLTYGTRGMDPFRCFPQFIRSLPVFIDKMKENVRIEIAGNQDVAYGSPPKGYKNWYQWAIKYCEKSNIDSFVQWKGYLTGDKYREWLQSSWCHIYLTHPFIASWSLVDSLAVGVPIVASDVPTVRDICDQFEGVTYVDHRDSEKIGTACADIMTAGHNNGKLYERKNIGQFSVSQSLKKWEAVTGVNLTTFD